MIMRARGYDQSGAHHRRLTLEGPEMRIPRAYRRLLLIGGACILVAAAFVAIALATERPSFCRTCHEMGPYVDAWSVGRHTSVSCIDCHVEPGMTARLSHKFVALGELWSHLRGTPPFPLDDRDPIPDRRCVRCHPLVTVDAAGFSHAEHERYGACERCHRTAGHDVSEKALRDAGVYNEGYAGTETTGPVRVDDGAADLPGHVAVTCARCHVMSATACPQCHEPVHKAAGAKKAGACETCHRAGSTFAFFHPKARTCGNCHTAPKGHRAGECASCHNKPGDAWTFAHPKSSDCGKCHTVPPNHYGSGCASCHSPRRAWSAATFSHPRIRGGEHTYRSFGCVKCHPASFGSYRCTCHRDPRGPADD